MITKAERAILISRVVRITEEITQIMEILMPDDEGCVHPPDRVEQEESMDDEPSLYRCTLCGVEQSIPFHQEN